MDTTKIATLISKSAFWIALAVIVGYLSYKIAEMYYKHKGKVQKALARLKKKTLTKK